LDIFRFGKDDLKTHQYNNLKKYVYENNNTCFGKYNIKEMQLASVGLVVNNNPTETYDNN